VSRPSVKIPFQVGQHVLVEASRREAAGVGFDLEQHEEEPDRLQRLWEVARRVLGQPAAGGGDAFQFLRTGCVAALRQFRRQRSIAQHVRLRGVQGNQRRVVEDHASVGLI
jgi:hypothetical protein